MGSEGREPPCMRCPEADECADPDHAWCSIINKQKIFLDRISKFILNITMKNTMTKKVITKSLAGISLTCMLSFAVVVPVASAAESWKTSFDEICSKVDASGSLSAQEMAALIAKADQILPEIQKSDDPAKKVYLRRLKNCRSMYEFMIESKKSSGK